MARCAATAKYRVDNVFIVSKAGPQKAEIVESLGISVFFDDSCKVVKALAPLEAVDRIFWMHADPN